MTAKSRVVSHALRVELIDRNSEAHELRAELCYQAADPLAVVAVFHAGSEPVRWVFARDLLAGGVFAHVGAGDVQMWPCSDNRGRATVVLELVSPNGHALVLAPAVQVTDFLRDTFRLVPAGHEPYELDIDSALLQLLAS